MNINRYPGVDGKTFEDIVIDIFRKRKDISGIEKNIIWTETDWQGLIKSQSQIDFGCNLESGNRRIRLYVEVKHVEYPNRLGLRGPSYFGSTLENHNIPTCQGVVVTNTEFLPKVYSWAEKKGIQLIDGEGLEFIRQHQRGRLRLIGQHQQNYAEIAFQYLDNGFRIGKAGYQKIKQFGGAQ